MNQHSANLTAASTLTAMNLGANFQDASLEVRAAAVLRSQRLPKPEVMRDAWRSLPGSLQDRIGTAALTHSFYSRESQEDPCALTLEAGVWAEKIETQALNDVETIAIAALPELYGTDEAEPAWMRMAVEEFALALRVGAEAGREFKTAAVAPEDRPSPLQAAIELHRLALPGEMALLSPVQIAIAVHLQAWQTLQATSALLDATGRSDRKGYVWPARDAEEEAQDDVLLLSCRDRADAAAMLAHWRWYVGIHHKHPTHPELPSMATAEIAARMADLMLILGEASCKATPGADLPAALAEHRRAWSAHLAAAKDEAADPDTRWSSASAAERAADKIREVPCSKSEDGAALVAHVEWYAAELERAGEDLTDGFGYSASLLRARAGDWAMFLGTIACPNR